MLSLIPVFLVAIPIAAQTSTSGSIIIVFNSCSCCIDVLSFTSRGFDSVWKQSLLNL